MGKLKDRWLREGLAEYLKRLTPFVKIEVQEIAEGKASGDLSPVQKRILVEEEAQRLLHCLPTKQGMQTNYVFALDVQGTPLSSEEFAAQLAKLALQGTQVICFVIGGAFGMGEAVRRRADMRFSFSRLTFTHQMARVLLAEQIYRAYKINRGEKYHW